MTFFKLKIERSNINNRNKVGEMRLPRDQFAE